MAPESMICRLCKRETKYEQQEMQNLSAIEICMYCKRFNIQTISFKQQFNITDKQRKILSKASCENFIKNRSTFTINEDTIADSTHYIPQNALEQLQYMLETAAENAPNLGQFTEPLNAYDWSAILMCENVSHFNNILDFASTNRWIDHTLQRLMADSMVTESIRLTVSGWEYLGNKPRRLKSKKAFVAMWFHPDLNAIYNDAIYPALEETGYQPDRVDKTNHDQRIDDAIISKIRNSSLVIADVTGERSGVYYEAGFAEGLGIPVIWLCNENWRTKLQKIVHPNSTDNPEIEEYSWKDRLHFDTRQLPHIFWTDAEDLKGKLIRRIQARNLDLKLNGIAGG